MACGWDTSRDAHEIKWQIEEYIHDNIYIQLIKVMPPPRVLSAVLLKTEAAYVSDIFLNISNIHSFKWNSC